MKTLRISKNNTTILRTLVLPFLFCGLIFSLASKPVFGYQQDGPAHRIALSVNESENALTSERLDQISEIGIDMLEISFPTGISRSDLEPFYLLLDTNRHFTTQHEVEYNRESILNSILSAYNIVPDPLRDNVAAVKVFNFPADYRAGFSSSSDSLLSQLSASVEKPFYYKSAFSAPEFPVQRIDFYASRVRIQHDSLISASSAVIYFEPGSDQIESLKALEMILNRSITKPESLIIIPADWFLARTEAQSSFSTIISSYLNGESVNFPMPAQATQSPEVNWPIILLLIIWASFILHYKYQPMYKATLPRYFFYHSFFVHDVQTNRVRNTTPGIIILLQHGLISGFFFYLLADGFMSEAGLQSLSYHYPALFYPGFEELSIFIMGVLFSLIFHLVSIAWLYLPNKKLKQIGQAINLYSWSFHINLIIATIAVYVVEVMAAQDWAIATVIVYFFFWFSGFIVAAIDGARFLDKFQVPNLFLTVGLYFLLIIASIIIALWLPSIYQPLEMAFMLP